MIVDRPVPGPHAENYSGHWYVRKESHELSHVASSWNERPDTTSDQTLFAGLLLGVSEPDYRVCVIPARASADQVRRGGTMIGAAA
jgi:hypothetical protein